MFFITQFLTGLIVVHVAWAYFYVCGTLLRKPRTDESPPEAILSIVIATAAGIALTGFVTFALGMIDLIRHIGFALWLVALAAAFFLHGDSPLTATFWRSRFLPIRRAALSPGAIVYAISLLDAIPSTLPDHLFDSLFFYNVLALEYAKYHHIIIDMSVRNPFYTNNWLLVETWWYTFHVDDYLPMLTWLTGSLSLLSVFALVMLDADRWQNKTRRTVALSLVIAGASAAALYLNPMFLWMNSGGMLDVQLGFLFLVASACAVRAVRSRDSTMVPPLIVVAAFLVGAKLSFFGLLPLFAALVFIAMKAVGESRRFLWALAVLVILSCPWYVSNFLQDGDPIPPIINLALGHRDAKWTAAEAKDAAANLGQRRGPVGLMTFPLGLYLNRHPNEFVSDGVTAVVLALMVPGAVLASAFLWAAVGLDLAVFAGILCYAIAFWLLTSPHTRFSLLFYGALCAFMGILLLRLARRFPALSALPAFIAVILMLPTPSSGAWLTYFVDTNGLDVQEEYTSRDAYLAPRVTGYIESLYISREFDRLQRKGHRVYTIDLEMLKYALTAENMPQVGDWFGSDGYAHLIAAMANGTLGAFLKALDVDAVAIAPKAQALSDVQKAALEQQLESAGFAERSCDSDGVAVFLKEDANAPPCDPSALI